MQEMVWVQRDQENVICGVYANRQDGYAEEELPASDPDVEAFRTALNELAASQRNRA